MTPTPTKHPKPKPGARCVVPVAGTHLHPVLCSRPATTTRVAGGVCCPLCPAHAAQLDTERSYR